MSDERQAEADLAGCRQTKSSRGFSGQPCCTTCTRPILTTGSSATRPIPPRPCSIAAVGLGLATIPAIVERGVIIRKFAAKIARRRLRSLLDLPQGPEPDAAGYKGFFYHFLDIDTGRRVWNCELSTLDSAFLLAGVLTCATYFDADTEDEILVRGMPTRSTAAPTGNGRAAAARRSRTAGCPSPGSFRIAIGL